MEWTWKGRPRSTWTAAALYLLTALILSSLSARLSGGLFAGLLSGWISANTILGESSPTLFLCACLFTFLRRRHGPVWALLAGLFALAWLDSLDQDGWSPWVYLNYFMTGDEDLATPVLKILSAALAVASIAISTLRLLPAGWYLRGTPLRSRTWPALALSFGVMAMWFVRSAIPYSVPGNDHGSNVEFRILHIRKNGLRFQETLILFARDARAYVVRADRRLFQYGFQSPMTSIPLPEASLIALQHAKDFVMSPETWKLRSPAAKSLWSWDAEGWYVVLKDMRLLAFTSENGAAPPPQVTNLFREIEGLPGEERLSGVRDVCLGFCYDPVAALGFSIRPQRARLLCENLDARTELSMARAATDRGEVHRAILHAEHAVSREPASPIAHFQLAQEYEQVCVSPGDSCPHWPALAIREYNRVLKLDPAHKDALKSLAHLFYLLYRLDEAEPLYRKAAKLDPNDAEALYSVAVLDCRRVWTVVMSEKARLQLTPMDPMIHSPLCPQIRTSTLPHVEEGIQLLTSALRLVDYADPQAYMAWLFASRAELQCGDRVAYRRDRELEQQWWNRAHASSQAGKQSPNTWILAPPPPPGQHGINE